MSTTQTTNSHSERAHEKYERLVATAKTLEGVMTAVAHPCDQSSLEGAVSAAEMGPIRPILIGPKTKIHPSLSSNGETFFESRGTRVYGGSC